MTVALWIGAAFISGLAVGLVVAGHLASRMIKHAALGLVTLDVTIEQAVRHTDDGRLDPTFIQDTVKAIANFLGARGYGYTER